MSLPEDVRSACTLVAARARHVRVVEDAVEAYAATLPPAGGRAEVAPVGDAERLAACSLQLNAINFGSGWFPTLRKPPGQSGFRTVEAGLTAHGPWAADVLAGMDARRIAAALEQDPEHELMGLFAAALRELGAFVADRFGGSFEALARSGEGSAVALASTLAALELWHDVSSYGELRVAFFKRAQIAAADLARAGVAPARDLGELTAFADNLVPHVLRLDGVLWFDDELVARIEREGLLEHGSPEEVEIRACAVHAVELLVAAHGSTTAAAVDEALWNRGAGPRYKSRPRHRSRTTAY